MAEVRVYEDSRTVWHTILITRGFTDYTYRYT